MKYENEQTLLLNLNKKMSNRILLIEDNKDISNNIKEYLELEKFIVDTAFDGEKWMDQALLKKYDLILLDLMLPEIDWLTISRKLTARIDTPIIIITAKNSINDKLKWFENGAIDYIIKPFDLRELEVRIKTRLKVKTNNKIAFKDVEVDLEKREFLKDWKEAHITIKEYLIFEFLYKNKEKVLTRTDIIEYVWWKSAIFDADWKLDVYISNLRKKLDKKIIETVKGIWYKYWLK